MDALKKKPLCIGLTGGIGSGKTTVSDYFAKLGVPVIDADIIAHQLTQTGQNAYQQIIMHFGKQILNADSTLNRKALRKRIFNQPQEKNWLEALLHPMIREEMQQQIQAANAPYCICVIPLLAESSGITFLDHVLLVETPIEIQIQRAKARDNTSDANIRKIIQAQAHQKERRAIAHDIIQNDGDITSLHKKIDQLHRQYLSMSN